MIKIFGDENRSSGLLIKGKSFTEKIVASENIVLHLLRGESKVTVADKKVNLYPKQMMTIRKNEQVQIDSLTNETYLLVYMVANELLNTYVDMTSYVIETRVIDHTSDSFNALEKSSNALISYLRKTKGQLDFHARGLSAEWLHLLTKNYLTKKLANKTADSRILAALLYIETNYKEIIGLEDIAGYFEVSTAYFSRYFKKQTGSNFLKYLTDFRLEKIAKKITESSEKISVIAHQEGFSNINSFNIKFKLKYGLTPRQYRKEFFSMDKVDAGSSLTVDFRELPETVSKEEVQAFHITTKDQPVSSNNQPWKKILNIGSAEDLLQYDLRSHVKLLKKDLDITYIRFWNIFTKGMNIDPTVTTNYNFEKIDSILDFLLAEGLKPFVELRYKIRRIHRSTREALVYEKEDFKFSLDSPEWYELVDKFMKHINERYGKKVVNEWMLEFSFEHYEGKEALQELTVHYTGTYEIIKKWNSLIKIGGPGAMAQNTDKYNYQEDLLYFYKNRVKFDFLSYMVYPYQVSDGGERNALRIENDNLLENVMTEVNKVVDASAYRGTEIFITEWNNTISNRNAINDSLYKGSYIIKNFSNILDKVDGVAYWVGSDLFSEFIDSRNILHGGAGLIGRGALTKPAFHAFRFMNFLENKIILKSDELIVSQGEESDTFSLVMYNYQAPPMEYYLIPEDEIQVEDIKHFFENRDSKKLQVNFQMAANKRFEVKTFRVNEEYGNVISGWKDIGWRSSLHSKDMEYLQLKADPQIRFRQLDSDINGNIQINEVLEPNEFVYLTLSPINE